MTSESPDQEPVYRSPEGIDVFVEGGSLVFETESIRKNGANPVRVSEDELKIILIECRRALDDDC